MLLLLIAATRTNVSQPWGVFDWIGIVNQPIHNAVGDAGITDLLVPVRNGQLAGQDSGAGVGSGRRRSRESDLSKAPWRSRPTPARRCVQDLTGAGRYCRVWMILVILFREQLQCKVAMMLQLLANRGAPE